MLLTCQIKRVETQSLTLLPLRLTEGNSSQRGEAKRRVVSVWFDTLNNWVFFLPCPYHYSIQKEGGIAERKPQAKTPTNPRHLRTDPA